MNQYERFEPMNPPNPSGETPPPMPLASADVTDRVWASLVAARDGAPDAQDGWSAAEKAAWSLYEPLLGSNEGSVVFAQIGQSLDGRVATVDGDAADISGSEGLKHLHRCRALADCVVVGANTAIQDDPRLTVRLVSGDDPARVVIDPRGRLGDDAAMMAGKGGRCLVVQCCDRTRPEGIETIMVPASHDGVDPAAILTALVERGFRRIMIEGGGITIGRFFDAGLIDRLHVSIAPLIIGAGPSSLTARPISLLSEARRPTSRVYGLATDIVIDCELG
ncbi:RibD family protein [Aliihoeflea aestuarii]|uniref:RibD family protein n=1 Tax=Aliihoeflea aestuarii TaxID=453840 RepID=UPI00209212D2|nr:RibD family protein [Aliihoeflea aestuarii]